MQLSYIRDNFEFFKNEVVKELIDYYGSKYRDLIISRIEDTNFIFYVAPHYSSFLISGLKKKRNYKELKEEFSKFKKDVKLNNLENNRLYKSKDKEEARYPYTINDGIICFSYKYNNNTDELCREIYIPVFYADDCSIIHEMIHSVMSAPLFLTEKDDEYFLQYKMGLSVSCDGMSDILEESLTEMDAKIIAKRIRKRKIYFIDKYCLFDRSKWFYDNFISYTTDFYKAFKDKINKARLTLNLRELKYWIGEEEYNEFINLIEDYYDNYYDCDGAFYKFYINKSVAKMKEIKRQN